MDNNKTKSVLIVGIDSQIGSHLQAMFSKEGFRVIGTTRRKQETKDQENKNIFLDLELDSIMLPEVQFDIAIICAGVNQSSCEENPKRAFRINVENSIRFMKMLQDKGVFIVFLSSNAVFDGTKSFYKYTENPNPVNNYGRYKVLLEEFLMTNKPNSSILRLTKVLTPETSFIRMWERYIAEGKRFEIFRNHFLSPVSLYSVANAVKLLIEEQEHGIFQLGGKTEISYESFALNHFERNPIALNLVDFRIDKNAPFGKHNSLESYLPS